MFLSLAETKKNKQNNIKQNWKKIIICIQSHFIYIVVRCCSPPPHIYTSIPVPCLTVCRFADKTESYTTNVCMNECVCLCAVCAFVFYLRFNVVARFDDRLIGHTRNILFCFDQFIDSSTYSTIFVGRMHNKKKTKNTRTNNIMFVRIFTRKHSALAC